MSAPHSLLKPLYQLEREYHQCVRHLSIDHVLIIESHKDLPEEFSGVDNFKLQRAHQLYCQIQARKDTKEIVPT